MDLIFASTLLTRSPQLLAAIVCLFLPMAAASALEPPPLAAIAVDLTPAATSIHWTLITTIHTVHGTFQLKSGAVRVDPTTGDAGGLIVIDATSAESGDSSRDKVMHRDVLESALYPEIVLKPTHVDGKIDLAAPGTVTLDGVLTLLGQDRPIQMPVKVEMRGSALHLFTHFAVPYVAWGLKDPAPSSFAPTKSLRSTSTSLRPSNLSPTSLTPRLIHLG